MTAISTLSNSYPHDSPAQLLARLPPIQRAELIRGLTPEQTRNFQSDWRGWWARPDQLAPKKQWGVWLVLAGRGFGKTRVISEWVREQVNTKRAGRIALVAPTASDARDVLVEGPSGIMACCPDWERPIYESSKRRLTFPNGAIAITYSADEPERLRGPQHDAAACDELAAWRYPESWDMLMFGMRMGNDPRTVVATTPKPVKLLKELLAREGKDVIVTRGSTYENKANLARTFLETIVRKYEGTRLGRQEILAELLTDIPNALWQRSKIDELRIGRDKLPQQMRIVIAIDPAAKSEEGSDETGIIVAGLGRDGHGYVLDDLSGQYQPLAWARIAIGAYHRYRADRILAEINNGGEMVEATLRSVDKTVSYKAVHATRGKVIRAEPIAALYEQGKVHHVGSFAKLEDQLCEMTLDFDRTAAGYSPDRLDAAVWALSDLLVKPLNTWFSQ